ncbi:sigma factor [Glycomyces algeriensis]|uniref:RNA polymerase sigma-70 region 2 domain-containing protein n=1 Tax=Glycomyces algeriensis TaxID=256037 RepID=A0A9W6G462_9ACTN|nr:sigma factor [Glycomyces algeriensis]MDA1368719.1 sigma factor [Glycomyces algeriensis]MDR7352508.1 RNA polymerase sigma factor (sigma-70 family) [Glycomyces algeriensis]GLI40191.1 hypothetical protein GALLR39Z86_00410 [Glycomyces algeriensis]
MTAPAGPTRDRAPDEFHRLLPLFGELARLAEDDPERRRCRERLITGHLPVVEEVVRRYAEVQRSELLEVGVTALIHAIDRFDPDADGDFPGFAVPVIVGEVRRYVRDVMWPKRTPSTVEVDGTAPRPPHAADVASRLEVDETDVTEAIAAWEARLPQDE